MSLIGFSVATGSVVIGELSEFMCHALWCHWWLYEKRWIKMKKKRQKCSHVTVNNEGNKDRMKKTQFVK